MTKTIAIFEGVSLNGAPLSNVSVLRSTARRLSARAEQLLYTEEGWQLRQVADSLFDLIDEVTGVTASLEMWLADPANRDAEEYSDIYKEVHGFRPRGRI